MLFDRALALGLKTVAEWSHSAACQTKGAGINARPRNQALWPCTHCSRAQLVTSVVLSIGSFNCYPAAPVPSRFSSQYHDPPPTGFSSS